MKEEAVLKRSLRYLNIVAFSMGFSHPVWIWGPDPVQAVMAATKAQLLVGKYPLIRHKCSRKTQLPPCPL